MVWVRTWRRRGRASISHFQATHHTILATSSSYAEVYPRHGVYHLPGWYINTMYRNRVRLRSIGNLQYDILIVIDLVAIISPTPSRDVCNDIRTLFQSLHSILLWKAELVGKSYRAFSNVARHLRTCSSMHEPMYRQWRPWWHWRSYSYVVNRLQIF